MKNIMLDLETYGTSPGCIVLSIGAVWFDRTALGDTFYQVINLESSRKYALEADPSTLQWWERQSPQAREVIEHAESTEHSLPLKAALQNFHDFVKAQTSVKVWGNGADFDNPILSHLYRAAGMKQPWTAYNGRCYRTLKNMLSGPKIERAGTVYHNALGDAVAQARHLHTLLALHPTVGLD